MHTHELSTSAADLKHRVEELQAERAFAGLTGLTDYPGYAADLDFELVSTRSAFVGAAVTEIASLRARLNGPLLG